MSRQRISKEGRLQDYHPDVGHIWRSRNEELEQEVFDCLPDWMAPKYEDRDIQIDIKRLLPKALRTLTKKEQMVIVCRLLYDFTLEEVGREVFDVSKERIRQIEGKAIRRFKHPSRSADLYSLFDVFPLKILKLREEQEAARKASAEFLARWAEKEMLEKLLKLRVP